MKRGALAIALAFTLMACADDPGTPRTPYVLVLGVAQDAGYPQAGCTRDCCRREIVEARGRRFATSLAVVDPVSEQAWIFDATPDIGAQLRLLKEVSNLEPTGIFLTHAHIGHYLGLAQLGRESMGADHHPVYAMPRMAEFLERNGPWDQLVRLGNIELRPLAERTPVSLNERITVTPLLVPHRDEYSETVGYVIDGPQKSALFIPDIDKWERWLWVIEEVVRDVDVAFLDATFYDADELPGRDMSEIPHPFVLETLDRFESLPETERRKVRLIHMNHTNPLLDPGSAETREVLGRGLGVARRGEVVGL